MIGLWTIAGYLALNLLAAAVTGVWYRRWCRSVAWSSQGLMPSAEPIDVGTGETAILFVHGFNDVPYVWRCLIDAWSQRGCRCRAMRLPGAGERDCRPTLASLRAAVDDELRALRKTNRRVVLVGHSMGGALALDAVLRAEAANRPDRLVLLAPLVEVSRARSPVLSARGWYLVLRALLPALRWVPSVFKEYLHAEDDETFVYRRDRFNEIGWYRALFALVKTLRSADKSRLQVPTLVVTAGDDRVVDSAATTRFFAGLPGVELREIPGASHVLPLNGAVLAEWNLANLSEKNIPMSDHDVKID